MDIISAYGTPVLAQNLNSQPNFSLDLLGKKFSDNSHRSLPIAGDGIAVVKEAPDPGYIRWLESIGMAPKNIVVYSSEDPSESLSNLIFKDPKRIQDLLKHVEGKSIYVPFYAGEKELQTAKSIGSSIFACDENITRIFFDKGSFKDFCRDLKINVIEGDHFDLTDGNARALAVFEKTMLRILDQNPKGGAFIRDDLGSGGSGILNPTKDNYCEVMEVVKKHKARYLLEPRLQVVSSPNIQGAIDLDGRIHFIGLSGQLFEESRHAGNVCWEGYYYKEDEEYIKKVFLTTAEKMAEMGYIGVFGVDFIITPSQHIGQPPEEYIFPVECNARVNGSTFAFAIVDRIEEKLGIRPNCWKFIKGQLESPCSFDTLRTRLDHLLYDGSNVNAVFMSYVADLGLNGKFTAVLTGDSQDHISYLEKGLKEAGVKQV